MIPFNKPAKLGTEKKYILKAINSQKISGDGHFSILCSRLLEKKLKLSKVLLTPSCTAALEMCAILLEIKPGDEVIMPSYTFVSTANAFALRGAKIIFVDIEKNTMNICPKQIEKAINKKTKAVVVVHYAGVSVNISDIKSITTRKKINLIEDAAHSLGSTYKNKSLGSFGDLATFSFHETKNITSGGEGGCLVINRKSFIKRAEIIREKGTNRTSFFYGQRKKYTWVDIGSSYLLNEISAAFLLPQIEKLELINSKRIKLWNIYFNKLYQLQQLNLIELPYLPKDTKHNGHLFYIKLKNFTERKKLINYLSNLEINAVFHYIPLHSSPAGRNLGTFFGKDVYTSNESRKILRLPLYFSLKESEVNRICFHILSFFNIQ